MSTRAAVPLPAIFAVCVAAACAVATRPAAAAPQNPAAGSDLTAIRNVRVFDGGRVVSNATVVIRDGLIAAVGTNVAVPDGARVVDGAGRTLLPGFIDSHTHTIAPAVLENALVFGVTTQLDMFTVSSLATQLRAEQAAGRAASRADLLSSGTVATAPRGHGTQYGVAIPTISSPDSADAFVRARVAEGSDYIKIIVDDFSVYGRKIPTLDEATMRALVAAAHKHGKLAVVHVSTLATARQAVAAGADGLVHIWMDSLPDDALVAEMVRRNTFVVPTLTVRESVAGVATGASLLADERIAPMLGPEERAQLKGHFPAPPSGASFAPSKAALAKLARGGVRILAGTDAPNPGTAHGASMHRELELLVEAGLTPTAALAAATAAPAEAFGLRDRGRVEPGRRADLVLVDGDPTTDIRATRAIVQVWKAGVSYDRAAYRARVAAQLESAAKTSAPTIAAGGTISDFDAGTTTTAFGTSWVQTTDAMMGGKSTASMRVIAGGAAGTSHALEVSGEIEASLPFAWGGAMFFPGTPPMTPTNLSASKGIRFHARGDGKTYRVLLFWRGGGQAPSTRTFTAGPEWQELSFPWSDFRGSDGSDVMGIAIVGGPAAGPYRLLIDQVRLY
jgi:imidazolonepropionase-like amidohydrolase